MSGEALRAGAWKKRVWRGAASRAREAEVYGARVFSSSPQLGVRAMRAEGELGLQGNVLPDPGLGAADGPVSVCVPRETWSIVWRPRR